MAVESRGRLAPVRGLDWHGKRALRRNARWTVGAILALVFLMALLGVVVGFHTGLFLAAEAVAIVVMLVLYSRSDASHRRRLHRAGEELAAVDRSVWASRRGDAPGPLDPPDCSS